MVQMATPWRHPLTGSYYIRRQIPEALRSCFGGKSLWQVSLKTKDLESARALFADANAKLEQRFADARAALSQELAPDRAQELVAAWLREPELKWPRGARLLWELEERAHLELGLPPPGTLRREEDENGGSEEPQWAGDSYLHPGDLWANLVSSSPRDRWRHLLDGYIAELRQAKALHPAAGPLSGVDEPLADALAEAIGAFGGPVSRSQRKQRRRGKSLLRPQMRLVELFDEWKREMKPSAQTAHEFENSARDFVELIGDIPVIEIVRADLISYRNEAADLPKSMPRADRNLPFTERVRKHAKPKKPSGDGAENPTSRDADISSTSPSLPNEESSKKPPERISPSTLKKRVGAIQALLSFACGEEWIPRNEGADIKIHGYSKAERKRNSYQDQELKQLFESELFLHRRGLRWASSISSTTLYWMFTLGLTSGARLEEVGQCLLTDVKHSGKIIYLDIDDYLAPDAEEEHGKSVKTGFSRRLVPIHKHVLSLGFHDYVESLKKAGHLRLFPDLKRSTFDKLSKEASRLANRYIDRLGLRDPRLVFHSLRHTFKDLARDADLEDSIIDQICGHAPTSEGGKYGQGARLSKVHRDLNRIRFEAIDWSLLYQAAATEEWRSKSEPE